ncbi:hypothetical protein HBI23_013520 [Parastagonospora nodorum]|nr:hypothetical protein HBI23_013520 [Parastagonospora nodorum]KAH5749592.1 hypothetical protein HBI17_102660 [Parastagonospora nodorum]KAH6007798.1 hypothetical protein HBI84_056000 [Parastagonospora nodorum]KAH6099095.1 hypothetical protein HBI65_066930 [Parastagonospora nodorum]KAH6129376.1 hypothetical protein HBI69_009670 [Parastagonospora nodorum]
MRLPPVDVLLSWPTPNYENPKTRGPALAIVNYTLAAVTIITVALRLYTRVFIKRWFGLDDVFIILALIFTLGLTAVVLLANQKYGWDRHVYDIPFNIIEPASKIAMIAKIVFTCAATFTRLSLHCFYYRLVTDTGKTWFRWLIHANVAYTLGIFISYPFIAIFLCVPVRAYWIPGGVPGAYCLDEGVATLICGIISCVADFITTITPMPLVMGLRMPRQQRLAVGFLFGLGIIVTIAGIVRTWYIYRSLFNEWDQTWYSYPLWIAAAVEIDLGVICASAPVLRPLLSKIPFNLSETFSRSKTSHKSTGTPSKDNSASSKRRADTIQGAPELAKDRGRSYELKEWDDLEHGVTLNDTMRGSQERILEDGDSSSGKSGKSSHGIRKKGSQDDARKGDMTITKTSEVQLHVSPASDGISRPMMRYPTPRRDTP